MSIEERLAGVRRQVAESSIRVGRRPEEILVVAVSKTFPSECVREAALAGQLHFGENRIQEAEEKVPALNVASAPPGLFWHLIGHLQSNKAKRAVQLFDWIHSVDSVDLLLKLEVHAVALGKALPVLLQLNLAGETTKSGMPEASLDSALDAALSLRQISVQGLMIIPPMYDDAEAARPYFQRLRELLDYSRRRAPSLPLRHLSMGMTHDFEVAIEEGATMIRVGTAIFGKRGRGEEGGLRG